MNKFYQLYSTLLLLSLTSTSALRYAKKGCSDMCGTVRIPFPFGIGAKCSLNKWYTVNCNSSTPYLSALNQLQVLSVDLSNQTVTVNTPMIPDCSRTNSIDLGRSPFFFSRSQNKFVFKGCGNAFMMDHGSVFTGCSTDCLVDSTVSERNKCFGIRCCQTTIPYHLKSYNMNLSGLERQLGEGRACGSAFLVDKVSYIENGSYVPVSLLWTLSDSDRKTVRCVYSPASLVIDTGNGNSADSWKCMCSDPVGVHGNPYLKNGCEEEVIESQACARCQNSGGRCYDAPIYGVNGLLIRWNFTCEYDDFNTHDNHKSKSTLGVILGVSISMGVVFLVATIYVLYKEIKKRKDNRQRKRFFKCNGGLLLKQQQEADQSLVNKTILFTSCELEKATDNFNDNRILGRGGQGTVYKGMLADGRIVAVKKSKMIDEIQLEHFINEVVILSQVNHRNVVKLLGCCLETEVPLLVSEFIPNGTLYDHLHKGTNDFPFSLNMRLQIATEVACALAYLHSATSIPIYHRDIKTTNILLDDKYRAKISDFGTSRFVSIDQTHLTTAVKGTFGYLDPEYFRSSQFTEKSDVYSFGVVLVELLTGERPISQTNFDEHRSLVMYFMSAMEEGRVLSIFDATVLKEGTKDGLLALANLATRCLNLKGMYRPTMNEVASELETIQTSHIPSSCMGTDY